MIVVVGAYFALAVAAPALVHALGRRAFWVLALLPAGTTAWFAAHAAAVHDGHPLTETHQWIPSHGLSIALRCDTLALLLVLLASGVGALVLAYCARYFDDTEPGLGRLAGQLLAFAGAMIALVTADDVIVLYLFWELTTVLSYLLVGHRNELAAARRAALQALTITTLGGLAMLLGLVMLAEQAGTARLSQLTAHPPTGTPTTAAVLLVLAGAAAKSAVIPFGSWLPAAMAAPTPVSAYLHAAAMVKAGVYLLARLAPAFAQIGPWRPLLLSAGALTMLTAGWRALREMDLKRLLAYGTVSQLGLLTVLLAAGTRDAALAGTTLLAAHALFKAALFLVVGVVDHSAGTRDVRVLSGIGRHLPVTCAVAVVAALSMAALPPMLGFVGKEAAYSAFLGGDAADTWVLAAVVTGSALTAAYTIRLLWGAFARKPGVPDTDVDLVDSAFLTPAAVLALAGVALGVAADPLGRWLTPYTHTLPATGPHAHYHLQLWHGTNTALWLSVTALAAGVVLFAGRRTVVRVQAYTTLVEPAALYAATVRGTERAALQLTGALQRGSTAGYLGVILTTLVVCTAVALPLGLPLPMPDPLRFAEHAMDGAAQTITALLVCAGAVAAVLTRHRVRTVLLVSVTGYGSTVLFVLHGAPDLALTQGLVETVSLVVFLLVLRRLPGRFPAVRPPRRRVVHAAVALATGTLVALVAFTAAAARSARSISTAFPDAAHEAGAKNIISALLVDIRSWDTLGEISVLAVATAGVTSLVFVRGRVGALPRAPRADPRAPARQPGRGSVPARRSVIFESVARMVFPTVLMLSLYFLFSGHATPGGGFAGGITAGLALLVRYLAGGRSELAEAVAVPPGVLLGVGLTVAALAGAVPAMTGRAVLQGTVADGHLPLLGDVHLATSLFFDIGVYLLVLGLVHDVLRSLGTELDRQIEHDPARPSATGTVTR